MIIMAVCLGCFILVQLLAIVRLDRKNKLLMIELTDVAGLVDAMAEDIELQDEHLDCIAEEALLMSRQCQDEQWSREFAKLANLASFREESDDSEQT